MLRTFLTFGLLAVNFSLFAFSFTAIPDTTDPGLLKQGAVPAKMIAARHEFLDNNMRGALTLYREVLEVEPNNAQALYRTAECHYNLKKYDLAIEYFDIAIAIDPEVSDERDFFRGQISHRLAHLDEAIASFEKFIASNPSKRSLEYELAQEYIAQCRYAKVAMASKADVQIQNLGRNINSRFDDYTPSISADGKYLVFTSRRSTTQGGEIDEGSDYKFFEDIFYSTWNTEDEEWEIASGLEGEVNTPNYDAVLSISPDGKSLFVYKNNANSAGDIFLSTLDPTKNTWVQPSKLGKPVNSSYFESSVSITADGKRIYFISERPGGLGQGDIWTAELAGNGSWDKPENLGAVINTALDEKFVFIHPNGRTLFFASIGHQTMGSYDIFKSEFVNGKWSTPLNLGYPINTVNEESTFSLTEDNKTLYIAAEYEDSFGERDIYRADVSKYEMLSGNYDKVNFGTVNCQVKSAGNEALKGVKITVFDANTDLQVTVVESNKDGKVQINLALGTSYRLEFIHKDKKVEKTVELQSGSSVQELEVKF
jgi:tetratricopeptide (TPR) repeat protein